MQHAGKKQIGSGRVTWKPILTGVSPLIVCTEIGHAMLRPHHPRVPYQDTDMSAPIGGRVSVVCYAFINPFVYDELHPLAHDKTGASP